MWFLVFLMVVIPPENVSPSPGKERRFRPLLHLPHPYLVGSVSNYAKPK